MDSTYDRLDHLTKELEKLTGAARVARDTEERAGCHAAARAEDRNREALERIELARNDANMSMIAARRTVSQYASALRFYRFLFWTLAASTIAGAGALYFFGVTL
jgi:hypothetical protein